MDILLTDEQILNKANEADKQVPPIEGFAVDDWAEYEMVLYRAICRAQLRNASLCINKGMVSPKPLPPNLTKGEEEIWEKGYRTAMADIEQALLRAALRQEAE